jgi:hypothetical protein
MNKIFEEIKDNKTVWRIKSYHGPWLGNVVLSEIFNSKEEAKNYLDGVFWSLHDSIKSKKKPKRKNND